MPDPAGNTFSDFPPEEFTILAFCDSCGHRGAVDRAAFPEDQIVQDLPIEVALLLLWFQGLQHTDSVHLGRWVSAWVTETARRLEDLRYGVTGDYRSRI
jgi:hypothetical protein